MSIGRMEPEAPAELGRRTWVQRRWRWVVAVLAVVGVLAWFIVPQVRAHLGEDAVARELMGDPLFASLERTYGSGELRIARACDFGSRSGRTLVQVSYVSTEQPAVVFADLRRLALDSGWGGSSWSTSPDRHGEMRIHGDNPSKADSTIGLSVRSQDGGTRITASVRGGPTLKCNLAGFVFG